MNTIDPLNHSYLVLDQPYKVLLGGVVPVLSGTVLVHVGGGLQHDDTVIGCVAPHLGQIQDGIVYDLLGFGLGFGLSIGCFLVFSEDAIVVFAPLFGIDRTIRITFACLTVHQNSRDMSTSSGVIVLV